MNINKRLLLASIQTIKTTENYPNEIGNWIKSIEQRNYDKAYTYLAEIETHLAPLEDDLDLLSVFPKWTDDNNAYWGTTVALTMHLLKALSFELPNKQVHIEGDYTVNQPTLIEGDLTIEGDLAISYMEGNLLGLVVLGNLTIKGNYPIGDGLMLVFGNVIIKGALDEDMGWSLTVIGGNLNVHKYLSSFGELFVHGKIISPFIYLVYNQGRTILNKGFSALYFHESDHGPSICFGKHEAQFIRIDEIQGVEALGDYDNYKSLQKLVSKEVLGILAEADFDNYDQEEYGDIGEYLEEELDFDPYELSDVLLSAFQEGKAVFNRPILEKWKTSLT